MHLTIQKIITVIIFLNVLSVLYLYKTIYAVLIVISKYINVCETIVIFYSKDPYQFLSLDYKVFAMEWVIRLCPMFVLRPQVGPLVDIQVADVNSISPSAL